jgi:hypothetical protein
MVQNGAVIRAVGGNSQFPGTAFGGGGDGIGDHEQAGARDAVAEVGGVKLADATGADDSEVKWEKIHGGMGWSDVLRRG